MSNQLGTLKEDKGMIKDVKPYIEDSIKMWEKIRDNGYADKEKAIITTHRPYNGCYICQYVIDVYGKLDCDKCPIKWGSSPQIYKEVGYCGEEDSPYYAWETIADEMLYQFNLDYIDAEYDDDIHELYKRADEVVALLKRELNGGVSCSH